MVKKKYEFIGGVDNISSRLKPGRHLCGCQARLHKLVRNCINCGRVVCQQEGSGPCLYCGTLVCSREEKLILEKRDKKALELLRKLFAQTSLLNFDLLDSSNKLNNLSHTSLPSLAASIQKAAFYKQKLLDADKDREITNVNDLQADYFSLELNPYLTSNERMAIVNRKEELRQLALKAKKTMLLNLNLSTGAIEERKQVDQIESTNDPILQTILANSINKNLQANNKSDEDEQLETIQHSFADKYKPTYKSEEGGNLHRTEAILSTADLFLDKLTFVKKNTLICIGLMQPLAADLTNSRISSIPWAKFIEYRGPVLIAAMDDSTCTVMHSIEIYNQKLENENLPTNAIVGYAILRDCIKWDEWEQELPADAALFIENGLDSHPEFVLIFDSQEKMSCLQIPCICPSEMFTPSKYILESINSFLPIFEEGAIYQSIDAISFAVI